MRGIDSSGVVQLFMNWVGNEGVDINWNVSPVSSPVTVLIVANSIKSFASI